ncbi:MAG: BglII/BstYI family type II restriction endonuclease [Anaerolineae bacterium]
MIVAGEYSFNNGKRIIESGFHSELAQIRQIIATVDPALLKTKVSRERTMSGRMLYNPRALNKAFKEQFEARGWKNQRVDAEYSTEYYIDDYKPSGSSRGAYRDMDFVKNDLGVEVQFGKYAFMVYNVAAKMTIFSNLGFIKAGVEIVPVKDFADDMSTGVSYFEQFVWDLEHRGISNIDVPVLILGITHL